MINAPVAMKAVLISFFVPLLAGISQRQYFVLVDSEKGQPFYIALVRLSIILQMWAMSFSLAWLILFIH